MKKLLILISLLIITPSTIQADGTYPVMDIPEHVVFSDVDNPYSISDIQTMITAVDDVDGDISESIYIILDTYSGNEIELGEYIITFGVKDSNQQVTRLVVEVRVVDITFPVINGINDYIIDINQEPIDYFETLEAIDNIDGDLTSVIVVDETNVDYANYGKYEVTFTVTDSSGNTTFETCEVVIKDLVPPTINGAHEVFKDDEDIAVITDLLHYITAIDNIDGSLSNRIVVLLDEYTGNGTTVGDYKVILKVTDSAGNFAEHEIIVKVRDNLPHYIYKDKKYIEVDRGDILTDAAIKELLTAVGELNPDSDYSLVVYQDQYTSNLTTFGEYNYFLRFTSPDGTVVEKQFVIQVKYSTEKEYFESEVKEPLDIVRYWWVVPAILLAVLIFIGYRKLSKLTKLQ